MSPETKKLVEKSNQIADVVAELHAQRMRAKSSGQVELEAAIWSKYQNAQVAWGFAKNAVFDALFPEIGLRMHILVEDVADK